MAVYTENLLWGCPQMNFKANPPFNGMKQGFATFKKETRMAPYLPELIENLQKLLVTDHSFITNIRYSRFVMHGRYFPLSF